MAKPLQAELLLPERFPANLARFFPFLPQTMAVSIRTETHPRVPPLPNVALFPPQSSQAESIQTEKRRRWRPQANAASLAIPPQAMPELPQKKTLLLGLPPPG